MEKIKELTPKMIEEMNYDDFYDGFLHGKCQMISFMQEYLHRHSTWRDVSPVFKNTRGGQSKVCDVLRLEKVLERFDKIYSKEIECQKTLK